MDDPVDQALAARRRQASRNGLGLGLLAACALHGGLLLALTLAPASSQLGPKDYVAVHAVPLAALGSPKPRQVEKSVPERPPELPPEPEVPAPKSAPVLPKPKPEPARPAPKTVDPKAPPKPATTPRGGSASPATSVSPDAEPEGSATGSEAGTSPFGATRLEGIDPEFTYDYYLDRMLALIHDQWQRPPTEGEVKVIVRFTVQKSGMITDLELTTPSGSNAFDLAALRAVQNAGPLPPLPSSYRRGLLTVTLIVR